MWTYVIDSGELSLERVVHGTGYSGHGEGKNCPAYQGVPCEGPIPCGIWEIRGPPFDTGSHGPYVLRLVPHDGTETFGRTGFLIHGDSRSHPGEASQGCIVMPREVRERVWLSGDRTLLVVASEEKHYADSGRVYL